MRPSRAPLACLLALGAALALAGCVPEPHPSASATATAPQPSRSASASATPRPTPSASGAATPGVPCAELASADTVAQYAPSFAPVASPSPRPGTAAAQAKADGGTVCEWVNQSTHSTIDLSVARYSGAALEAKKTASAAGAQPVTEWGADAGYFAVRNGVGVATAFVGGDWITTASSEFEVPSDADLFQRSAVARMRSAG